MDEPSVLLFDEPTSGVDIGSEDVVFDLLHRLSQDKGITILFISHDLHVVERYADLILAMNKKLIYYGDPKELEKNELTRIIFGDSAIILRLKEGKRA